MNKIYKKHNFHKHTFCIWNEVPFDQVRDLQISYVSQSGSRYIFKDEGLYRISNHWGRVANCHWRLMPLADFKRQHTIVGYANWSDFYSNDDTSKLFFIKVDTKTDEVNFYHKQSLESLGNIVLRNAKDTAKNDSDNQRSPNRSQLGKIPTLSGYRGFKEGSRQRVDHYQ
ncbi:hypothetical protein [Flavobacterium sp.]